MAFNVTFKHTNILQMQHTKYDSEINGIRSSGQLTRLFFQVNCCFYILLLAKRNGSFYFLQSSGQGSLKKPLVPGLMSVSE